jgi:SAM-dependent methyltransferase
MYGDRGGTAFLCADGVRMPLCKEAFDVVVSFETLEHIRPYRGFLAECKRVLRDNGTLVCSTPNRRLFSPNIQKPLNPFHVHEFWPEEFRELLSNYFSDISLYGQCDVTMADNSVERDRGVHEFTDNEQISSGYIIAVAKK